MLEGNGGNIGVSYGEDGVLLIDDQFAPLSAKIRTAVAALSKKPVRFVFNTHWHGDHTGGNEPMAEAGALIVAHDNVRKRLSVEQFISLFDQKIPPSPAKALPVVTFSTTVAFHINGDDIEAVHLPAAHTDGDAVLRFRKANVIHAGDCFVNGRYPVIDVDSGGSVDGLIAAQQRIVEMADGQTKIIPGHGPLGDKASVQAAHHMLQTVRDRVHKLLAQRKSVDEIKAAKPTADFEDQWGKGAIKGEMLVQMIARSLSPKR